LASKIYKLYTALYRWSGQTLLHRAIDELSQMKGEEITHIVFISGENEEQKKVMKIGKKMRT